MPRFPQLFAKLQRVLLGAALTLGVSETLLASSAPLSEHELEVKVWTADDHELAGLEREVVRIIQERPESALAHLLLSHVLVRQFNHDPGDLFLLKQASDLAQQALDLDPNSDVGYVAVADILDLMGNPDRGLALLTEAENLGVRKTWRIAFTRSRLLSDDVKTDKVLGYLDQAMAAPDAEYRIIAPYVVAMLSTENKGESLIAKLEEWNKRYPTPLFEMTMAVTNADLGRAKKASELYTKVEAAMPDGKEALINHAILLYRDLKDAKRATALFEKVLKEHKNDLNNQIAAMVHAHRGAAEISARHYDKAAAAFVEALKSDPTNLTIVDFITRTYRDQKLHKELVGWIRKVNSTLPGTGVLYALLGETLSESLADHAAAQRAFLDAITLQPERGDYYNGLGLVFYRQKSFDRALKSFNAATEVDPNDGTARYNQACVLSLMGRADDALTSLSEAVTLDPRLILNAKTDADFAGLRELVKFQQLVQQPASKGGEPPFLAEPPTKVAH